MTASDRALPPTGRAFAVVLAGTFMGGLDTYIVTLALPRIAAGLGVGIPAIQWMVLAYLLPVTCLVVGFGRLADMRGPRPIFIAGLAVFTLGSAASAVASDIWWLVGSRAIQGTGSALMLAAGQALVVELYGGGQRGRALGWMHVAVSAGFALGPLVGGQLLDRIGWRSVFLVNVPIGALTLIAAARPLPRSRPRIGQSFDFAGTALLALVATALLLTLTEGRQGGFLIYVAGGLAASLLLTSFLLIERRARQPVVDLRLFREWRLTAALLAAFLTFVVMASNMFLVPFLLQDLMALTPSRAGLVMVAVPLAILGVAPVGGRLADRLGPRLPATAGLAAVTLAVFLMAWLGAGTAAPLAAAVLALYGVGAGLFQGPNNSAALDAAPSAASGVASGMLVTSRQLGQVVGVALATAIWTQRWDSYRGVLPSQAALGLGFRDAFLALALVGVMATLVSLARKPMGRRAARVRPGAELTAE